MVAIDLLGYLNGTQLVSSVSADASLGGSEKVVLPGRTLVVTVLY
ncbi:hypothetical protein [Listeria monocytogenes]|nr:hypothetical protein [Listeria monocytogenes]